MFSRLNWTYIIIFIQFVLNILVPYFVYLKNKKRISAKDISAKIYLPISTFLLGLGIWGWQATLAIIEIQDTFVLHLLAFVAALLAVFGLLLFTIFFPYIKEFKNNIHSISTSIAVGIIFINIVGILLTDLIIKDYVDGQVIYGIGDNFFRIGILYVIGLTVYRLFSRYKEERDSEEILKYIFIAFLILIPILYTTNFLLPFNGNRDFIFLGVTTLSVFPIVISYLYSRPKVYSVKYFLLRSVKYILIATAFFLTVSTATYIYDIFGITYQNSSIWVFNALFAFFYLALQNQILRLSEQIISSFTDRQGVSQGVISNFEQRISKIVIRKKFVKVVLEVLKMIFLTEKVNLLIVYKKKNSLFFKEITSEKSTQIKGRTKTFINFIIENNINTLEDIPDNLTPISFDKKLRGMKKIWIIDNSEDLLLAEVVTDEFIGREKLEVLSKIKLFIKTAFERIKIYEQQLNFNKILKSRVDESTKEITKAKNEIQRANEKLSQAYAELKTLDDAKSEFISIASHQLRTPISIIRGYLSMMEAGDFGEVSKSQLDALEKTSSNIRQLNDIVEDILNASRIERGKIGISPEETDIVELTNNVVAQLYEKAKTKGLDLICKGDHKDPYLIKMDRNKIYEVIMNLVDNAIHYTKEGSITVNCKVSKTKILISVKDTGIGIPKEFQNKIFQRFSRSDNAKAIRPDGTGIGLYVAKSFVEAHKGKLWFESVENKGTTFFVELKKNPKFE